jgi:serine/threonine protein phosphatase PrpC
MSFLSFTGICVGKSHEATGKPCEDTFKLGRSADDKWHFAVISDGCGSAPSALQGSEFISEFLLVKLNEFVPLLNERGPGEWLVDKAVSSIAELREAMRVEFQAPLSDYSATIVAAIISGDGGFFLHLGDGISTALSLEGKPCTGNIRLVTQSDPENGEYANQTYYVTEPDWVRHIRITPIAQADCLILCSDGAQDLFYEGNRAHGPALIPLLKKVAATSPGPSRFLYETISSSEAESRSSDDKTIVIIASNEFLTDIKSVQDMEIIGSEKKPQEIQADLPSPSRVSEPLMNKPLNRKSIRLRRTYAFLTNGKARKIAFFSILAIFGIAIVAMVIWLGLLAWDQTWDLINENTNDIKEVDDDKIV